MQWFWLIFLALHLGTQTGLAGIRTTRRRRWC